MHIFLKILMCVLLPEMQQKYNLDENARLRMEINTILPIFCGQYCIGIQGVSYLKFLDKALFIIIMRTIIIIKTIFDIFHGALNFR